MSRRYVVRCRPRGRSGNGSVGFGFPPRRRRISRADARRRSSRLFRWLRYAIPWASRLAKAHLPGGKYNLDTSVPRIGHTNRSLAGPISELRDVMRMCGVEDSRSSSGCCTWRSTSMSSARSYQKLPKAEYRGPLKSSLPTSRVPRRKTCLRTRSSMSTMRQFSTSGRAPADRRRPDPTPPIPCGIFAKYPANARAPLYLASRKGAFTLAEPTFFPKSSGNAEARADVREPFDLHRRNPPRPGHAQRKLLR